MDILDYENEKEYIDQFIDDEERTIFISAAEGQGIDRITEIFDKIEKIDRSEDEYP